MFKKTIIFIIICFFTTKPIFATPQNLETKNSKIIIWNSPKGIKMLANSKFKNDFYQLANFYQPQKDPLFCAIASSVIILNALNYGNIDSQKTGEITKPRAAGGNILKYNLYSQQDFLNHKTDKIKDRKIINYQQAKYKNGKKIYDVGIGLRDLSKMLEQAYKLKTQLFFTKNYNQDSISKFRHIVKKTLNQKNKFIIINFNGKTLKQKTGGHISPLAAYNSKNDSILILDTALHKNQWYWVKLTDLYKAMNSKDGNSYRGYMIISK